MISSLLCGMLLVAPGCRRVAPIDLPLARGGAFPGDGGDMSKKKPPAFPCYTKEWNDDTSELALDEQGAYWRLLCHGWTNQGIPASVNRIASVVGVSRQRMARLWGVIGKYWEPSTEDASRLVNPRQETIRAEHTAYWAKKSEAGTMGAEARWGDGKPDGKPMADGMANGWPSSASASSTSPPPAAASDEPRESRAADALRLFDQAAKDHAVDDQQQQQGNKNSRQNRRQKP